MAAFDSATSDLFCNEETKAFCFYGDDDDDGLLHPKDMNSEPLIHLPCLSEDCVAHMLEREREHLPRNDYHARLRNGELDFRLRREALDWLLKACSHFDFGEMCLYSAIAYFDRFLSINESPLSLEKNWAVQLAAVACLSLAAKIEEVNVPSTIDLQVGSPKFLFEGKTIQRMEILVLNALNWRIKAYTPCNFIDYYLRKMNEGELQLGPLIHRSLRIISNAIEGIELLEFKPSEIAAAVAVFVSREMQTTTDVDEAISCLVGIDKGRAMKCLELIRDSLSTKGVITTATTSNTTHSPNGVLDAAFLSYKSDETSHTSKRRKLDKTM